MALIRIDQIGTGVGLIQPKQIAGFAGTPLLPFYDGQFNRDNGPNTSCLTAASRLAIVGGDIMRRQDRGIGAGNNFFVEPARTQIALQTQFFPAPWAPLNGAVLTAQATIGPNSWGVHLASSIAYSASAVSLIQQAYSTNWVPSNVTVTLSVWAKISTGNGSFKFQITDNAAAVQNSGVMTSTSFWKRFSFTVNSGTGIGPFVFRLVNGDATAHAVFFACPQLEVGTEASSYIFNDTVAYSYTAPDILQFVPAQVPRQYREGRSAGIGYPARSTANMIVNADRMVIRSFGGPDDTLELAVVSGAVRLLARTGGVTRAQSAALVLNEYDAIAYTVDPAAGQLTVNGVPGAIGTPFQYPPGTSVRIGGIVGGNSEFHGELAQEYAA